LAYTLKRLLVGKAKKTAAAIHERLSKKTGLAVFASDALSSTAYASEEILLVLAVAYAFGQTNGFNYIVPITFAIAIVLVIVAISYRQTIFAYASGGGAYIVAKENLGTMPGLVAAAALLVDYVLTVSVSISAGVAAITSAAQGTSWAWLDNHKVFLCLGLIALIALANLRGVREAGALFAGPMSWFYFVIQGTTALILILAANTSFADFPRLASLLARDRFVPRQFATRGDKLVFSNGIIILAVFAGVLVVAFGGDTSRLIPLYAVGVFLSFTLSQVGMVRHWLKAGRELKSASEASRNNEHSASVKNLDLANAGADSRTLNQIQITKDKLKQAGHWKKSIVVNGLGGIATFIVLVVLVITKFIHGAWIVVVLIPLLVALFRVIQRHYVDVATQLTAVGSQKLQPIRHEVIVPISGIHRGVLKALEYAKAIAPHHVTAVYINVDEEATQKLRTKWTEWVEGVELVVIASPYRSLVGPLARYVDRRISLHADQMVTIVLPEFIPSRWWHHLLHNQTSLLLKGALLFKPNVVVTSVA